MSATTPRHNSGATTPARQPVPDAPAALCHARSYGQHLPPRRRLHRRLASVAGLVVLALAGTVLVALGPGQEQNTADLQAAAVQLLALHADATDLLASASTVGSAAAAAEGEVLAPNELETIASHAAEARSVGWRTAGMAAAYARLIDANTQSHTPWLWEYLEAHATLTGIDWDGVKGPAAGLNSALTADKDKLTAAMAAWGSEKARQAVEQEQIDQLARNEVAAQYAAASKYAQRHRLTPPAPPIPGDYEVQVRAQVPGYGGENGHLTVDPGGSIAVIWPGIGTIVAAHNVNDARTLQLKDGDTVRFTGAVSGTYAVNGSLDVQEDAAPTSVAPLHGDMMLQTSYFNSSTMRIVKLTPVIP